MYPIARLIVCTIQVSNSSCFVFRLPVNKTRPCIVDFLKASRRCLKTEDQPSLDITLNMINAAIDFMCHNSGDRIASTYFRQKLTTFFR